MRTDEWGYSGALVAALAVFDGAARRSGRTTRLVERVQDGDAIICTDDRERARLERLLRAAGKKDVAIYARDPRRNPLESVGTRPRGRTYFDHEWVRQFYAAAIADAERHLQQLHGALSKTWPDAPQTDEPMQMRGEYLRRGFSL